VTSVIRPQAQRSREAILRAATELIETEGASAVTHQRVAERAGVGRATVYRHWPSPVQLLHDALALTGLRFLDPAPGPLVGHVRDDLRRVARELSSPTVLALMATVLDQALRDDGARRLRDRLASDVLANVERSIADAVDAGELRAAPRADDLVDQLLGPLWSRALVRGRPIDDEFIEQVVDAVLAPWLRDPQQASGQASDRAKRLS
jgi:AcrR family transcriptional regulator